LDVRPALVPPALANAYAGYVRRTLGPAWKRIGDTPAPGEAPAVTSVRAELMRALADAGRDREVLAVATERARRSLTDPAAVPPSLAPAVTNLSAIEGDGALWDAYRTRYEAAKTPSERQRFLAALGYFRDSAL